MELQVRGRRIQYILNETKNAKPFFSRPHIVPKANEKHFKKEVEIYFLLGVSKKTNDSSWRAPYFAQPKAKTNLVQLISDLNMIYYNIQPREYASNLCIIIPPQGKYQHIRLPMGSVIHCTFFKRKRMTYSMGSISYVHIYINF